MIGHDVAAHEFVFDVVTSFTGTCLAITLALCAWILARNHPKGPS